jgi:hypothetical protein
MLEKFMDPNFEPLRYIGPLATIRPQSQNLNIGYDGGHSIKNFVLNKE